eukprot:2063449-Amphidinium_carterae.1
MGRRLLHRPSRLCDWCAQYHYHHQWIGCQQCAPWQVLSLLCKHLDALSRCADGCGMNAPVQVEAHLSDSERTTPSSWPKGVASSPFCWLLGFFLLARHGARFEAILTLLPKWQNARGSFPG